MFCDGCGATIEGRQKFCSKCGKPIAAVAPLPAGEPDRRESEDCSPSSGWSSL